MFNAARASSSNDQMKAGASELLHSFPVFRCLLNKLKLHQYPELRHQLASVSAMFKVLDVLGNRQRIKEDADLVVVRHATHMAAH